MRGQHETGPGRWPCRRGSQALARRAPGRLQDGISLWNLKESNILKMLINDSTGVLWCWPLVTSVFLSRVQWILSSHSNDAMMTPFLPPFHGGGSSFSSAQLVTSSQRRVISSCQCCQCSCWPVTTHTADQAAIHLRQLNPNWPVININDAVTARD